MTHTLWWREWEMCLRFRMRGSATTPTSTATMEALLETYDACAIEAVSRKATGAASKRTRSLAPDAIDLWGGQSPRALLDRRGGAWSR